MLLFLITAFFLSANSQTTPQCDGLLLKKELKVKLKPNYKYDSSKSSRFTYKAKEQTKEIEVPLFMGEKYRFLFNLMGLPLDVKVEIYSKQKGHKKRKLLYSLDKKEGEHIYSFEPEKSRKMYINYTIPKTSETELKGCLIFVLGYQIKVLKVLD